MLRLLESLLLIDAEVIHHEGPRNLHDLQL